MHVDYIHTFNDNLIKLVKLLNKRKKTIINISLGKNGPIIKNSSILMEWGPHILSIINFVLNNKQYKLVKSKIYLSKNSQKCNYYLEFKYKNIIITSLFGNNFKRKITNIIVKQFKKTLIYKDKKLKIINNNNIKEKNYQKNLPLVNSIVHFISCCKINKYFNNKIHEEITEKLEKMQSKLIY